MQKEKSVKSYTRRTKSGKTVVVHAYKAKYDAAEEMRKALAKKEGAGKELADKKKQVEQPTPDNKLGFSAEEFKAWYHWDTESDPKNKTALKVEKALKKSMGTKEYKKFYDDMTDGYSARGHNKAFKGLEGSLSSQKKETSTKGQKGEPSKKEKSLLAEGYVKVKAEYTKGDHTGHVFNPETGEYKKAGVHKGEYLVSPDGKKVYEVTDKGVVRPSREGPARDAYRLQHPEMQKLHKRIEKANLTDAQKRSIWYDIKMATWKGFDSKKVAEAKLLLERRLKEERNRYSKKREVETKPTKVSKTSKTPAIKVPEKGTNKYAVYKTVMEQVRKGMSYGDDATSDALKKYGYKGNTYGKGISEVIKFMEKHKIDPDR